MWQLALLTFLLLQHNGQTASTDRSKQDWSGAWEYVNNPTNADVPQDMFTLRIQAEGNAIQAQYCAIANSGGKIDCENGTEYNVTGKIENGKVVADFYSFFGTAKDKGLAELIYIDANSIRWKIVKKPKSKFYCPDECVLVRKQDIASQPLASCITRSGSTLPWTTALQSRQNDFKDLSCNLPGEEPYLCDRTNLRYLPMPSKGNIQLIAVPMDCGDFSYRYYLLTVKNNKVKDGLYVEGEWQEPEDDKSKEKTSFTIDKQFILTTKKQTKEGTKVTQYTISDEGSWQQKQ